MDYKAAIFQKGGKKVYTFPFPYLSKQFVKARYERGSTSTPLEYNRDYSIDGHTLSLHTEGSPEDILCIYRQTPTGNLVDFNDGSILLASELDKMNIQLLHITEEQNDSIHLEGMFVNEGAWQAQGRRIKNVAAPVEATDAVHLAYLDGLDIARQSELQRIETLVSEKERQAAESARESKEAATQSAQQFTQTIEARFQTLTTLLQQKLSTEYVPQTQASREHQELRIAISNAGITILQRSKTYAVGDIAYHKNLPSWARLECVTAGTTGSNANVFSKNVKAGQYIIDGGVRWIVDDLRDGTPVGVVRGSLYVPAGYVKANGAAVQRADYPRLVALADRYRLWTSDVPRDPGLFGRADGSTTMVLPNWIDRMVQLSECNNGTEYGKGLPAGLPNITGQFAFQEDNATQSQGYGFARVNSATGAFQGIKRESWHRMLSANVLTDEDGDSSIEFNASKSNSIYGRSSTVQPAAIQLFPIIKY